MRYGNGDPMQYLNAEDLEFSLIGQIAEEVVKLVDEDNRRYWKNMEIAVANGIAKAFGN